MGTETPAEGEEKKHAIKNEGGIAAGNVSWADIRSAHTNGKNAMIHPLRHDSHQKEWANHRSTGLGRT